MSQDRRWIPHLLRRAGFGPAPAEEEAWARLGFEGAVERLVGDLSKPAPPDPAGFDPHEPGAAEQAWLERMLSGRAPLAEKLALFWHGHFATSNRKLSDMQLLWSQCRLFRSRGGGPFEDLVKAVSRDPAMVLWLDGTSNVAGHPNENYARELMELFTLGVGHYSEHDVREAARAFTGWGCRRGRFEFRAEHHDGGTKTVLGQAGPWDGDDVARILCRSPRCADFVTGKLLGFFATPRPSVAWRKRMAAAFGKAGGRIAPVLRALFLDPEFRTAATQGSLVKSPVEFLVGGLREAGIPGVPDWSAPALGRMGQALFYPPSVKGWDGGLSWLSGGGLVERLHAADRIAALVRKQDLALRLAGPEFQVQ